MAEQQKRVTFDPTINLGHILTFVGFILGIVVSWATLDKRLTIVEEGRKTQDRPLAGPDGHAEHEPHQRVSGGNQGVDQQAHRQIGAQMMFWLLWPYLWWRL